jgi:hypothetical protein
VLVVLVALVTASILPALADRLTRPVAVDAAGLQLEADLRYAQQLAVTQRTPHAVEFTMGSGSYRIVRDPGAARSIRSDETLVHGVVVASTTLPASRALFDLIGSPEAAGDIVLSIAGGGETVTITIAAGSGAVRRGN